MREGQERFDLTKGTWQRNQPSGLHVPNHHPMFVQWRNHNHSHRNPHAHPSEFCTPCLHLPIFVVLLLLLLLLLLLPGMLEGQEGFDLTKGTWQRNGWRELDDLRKKLENLKELRELVRSLGRGGGKGPLRRAPEEVRGWWWGGR